MEIAGIACSVCGKKVVFAPDGKCCPACGIVLHHSCDARNTCAQCGRQYQNYESPTFNVERDAVMPRSMRAVRGGATAIVVAAGLLVLFTARSVVLLFGH